MRRKDREVQSPDEIFDILNRCDTVRMAFRGEHYPYVVPVSFGAELVNGKVIVYFHCAREGMKLELLKKDPRICLEGDIFIRTETADHGVTIRYESVIGFGECRIDEDEQENKYGLKLLTGHDGYPDDSPDRCRALEHLYVVKAVLSEITGKRNLPATTETSDSIMPSVPGCLPCSG